MHKDVLSKVLHPSGEPISSFPPILCGLLVVQAVLLSWDPPLTRFLYCPLPVPMIQILLFLGLFFCFLSLCTSVTSKKECCVCVCKFSTYLSSKVLLPPLCVFHLIWENNMWLEEISLLNFEHSGSCFGEDYCICSPISLYLTCLELVFCVSSFSCALRLHGHVLSIWMSWSFHSCMRSGWTYLPRARRGVMVKKAHSTAIWDCLKLLFIGILFQN